MRGMCERAVMTPTWRTILSDGFTHLLLNWKTTVQAVLGVAIALGTYFTLTPSNVIPQPTVAAIALMCGAAKVILGFVQTDAPPNPKQ